MYILRPLFLHDYISMDCRLYWFSYYHFKFCLDFSLLLFLFPYVNGVDGVVIFTDLIYGKILRNHTLSRSMRTRVVLLHVGFILYMCCYMLFLYFICAVTCCSYTLYVLLHEELQIFQVFM